MATTAESVPATPYHRIGGLAVLQLITDRFYDLMDSEPDFAELRAMHAADLAPMRDSLPRFLAGWSGGPRDWFEAHPGKCMASMHAPFPITHATADQWARAMRQAITDVAPADQEIAVALGDVLTRMALGMAKA